MAEIVPGLYNPLAAEPPIYFPGQSGLAKKRQASH